MTDLPGRLIAYASGQADDGEAREIEALLARYVDQDLDAERAVQVERTIDQDQALATIVAEARAGKQWFDGTLGPALQPLANASASPELQRFVEMLTANGPPDRDDAAVVPMPQPWWPQTQGWYAIAASIVIAFAVGGVGVYSLLQGRLDDAQFAQERLQQDMGQRSAAHERRAARIVSLEEQVQRQASDLTSAATARAAAQRKLEQSETAIRTLQSKRSEVEQRVAAMQAKLDHAVEQQQSINANHRRAIDRFESEVVRVTSALALAEDRRRTLEIALAESGMIAAALTAETSALEQQVVGLQSAARKQAADLKGREREIGDLTAKAASLRSALDDAVQQVARLGAYRQTLEAALEQSRRELMTDWTVQIARYHSLYAQQPERHLVEVPADEQDHIEQWLSDQLGRAISVPDLSKADIIFKGARLLAINGMPVAQLMYLDADDEPLAFCLMRNMSGKEKEPDLSSHQDMNLVDWSDGAYQYAIVGSSAFATLEALAHGLGESYRNDI